MKTSRTSSDATVILDSAHTELLKELDRTFSGWARADNIQEITPPPIYEVTDLQKLDVYENFPHLSLVATSLYADRVSTQPTNGAFIAEDMLEARFGLPMAACYGAYLFYENSVLGQDTAVTLANRCFRNEDKYEGLRRLASFTMREIVALGSFEHTQNLLTRFAERIEKFAREVSLDLTKVAASDPFFAKNGTRAMMQKLSPVKHEFRADELAISSVNTHRNYFGERCRIRLANGEFAFTSCVAFGLERWVAVLVDSYQGDPAAALVPVHNAAARSGERTGESTFV
jgi:seryl-tRNA synthetase